MAAPTRSQLSFLIVLVGIFVALTFLYNTIATLTRPLYFKTIGADYEYYFDNNDLNSHGAIEAPLSVYGDYNFMEGYDREGVSAESEALRVSDGGRYSAISAALFVYIRDDYSGTLLNLRQRRNVYFRIYEDGTRVCLTTNYYDTIYEECFTAEANTWHSFGLRWGSGYDVEYYMDSLDNVKYVPYDGSTLRVNSIRLGGYVDEVKIAWDYLPDQYMTAALKLWTYPISREVNDLLNTIFWLIFATTLILLITVPRAVVRPTLSFRPVYILGLIEIGIIFLIIAMLVSFVTGVDVIHLLHVANIDGYIDALVGAAAMLLFLTHMAMVYEASIRM